MRPIHHLLVTGGAGFIGSAFIRYLLKSADFTGNLINLDLLTYAANLNNLRSCEADRRYHFIRGDICDQSFVEQILQDHEIDTVVHFAAQTHVDRSIVSARPFIETNVVGTLSLLEAIRKYPQIHFHHISTDEVYGALGPSGKFDESSHYRPNSPYSASKAASDHLVRAFASTYDLSVTLSHCSNNYGPGQHPEKFIPLMIQNCLQNQPLPIYGKGTNIRDWLYVDDHAEAIWSILRQGKRGHTYDIGGKEERSNLELLDLLIDLLAKITNQPSQTYRCLIHFVADRPGHDFRYAVNTKKITQELGWQPKIPLIVGLDCTIRSHMV